MKKMPTGYGMVQTEVMKLKGLSIEAKAIYCLLASYTGSKEYCFPKIETMCEDLGVSEQRFYKHIRQLKEKNLIKITKLYGDMRNNNKYEIGYIDTPQNICLQHPQNEGVGIPQNEGVINSISINNNRGIEEKPQSLKLKHKKEMEAGCKEWLDYYNHRCGSVYKSIKPLLSNFSYWKEIYSMDELKIIIHLAQDDEWFKNKMTPMLLLRTKNKNGDCDYIGELLEKYKGRYDL